MGKKKQPGGTHKTPRVNVGFPEPWHAVARKLAAKSKQPVLFMLIDLLIQAAEQEGIEGVPPPPWEDEANAD